MLVCTRSKTDVNYYISEIRLNKNKGENSKKANNKKRLTNSLVSLTLISLLILAPVTLFSATAATSEPSLDTILNDLGFTNIVLTDVQTFSPGIYNITLMAEFASYNAQNELSYYAVGTSDLQTIFAGPEGVTEPSGGYVVPPIFKYFESDAQFGISMLSPEHRYYTEHYLNPDFPEIHAKVYANLDTPGMYLIGFENLFGESDRDFNDLVFSLVPRSPEIVSVTNSPLNPNYDQSVTVSAQIINGSADIYSVILIHQIESASWVNVTMRLDNGFYVANIPAQPYETTVDYKVYVNDTIGLSDVSALYSYKVGDSVPPIISGVLVLNYPKPNQSIKVSATITEPADASGVKNGTLWYTTDTVWSFLEMMLRDGSWTATIPGQSKGTTIEYYIKAFDNAENSVETSNFSYMLAPNKAPLADFSISPSAVFTGEVTNFDGSASYDLDGYVARYIWNFGDGTTVSGVTTSHSYVDNGQYFVTLTVFDDEGAKDTKTMSIIVKNRAPIAKLTASASILDKQEIVTFDGSGSYDPDGNIVSFSWAFGDGTTGTGIHVTHSYFLVGSYTTTLTVTDNDGATDIASTTKTVRNNSPVAIIEDMIKTSYVGDTVTFNAAKSRDPDGYIVAYAWDFGDGTTATGITVSHAYKDNGVYTVTLIVTDNDGATSSADVPKTVMNRQPVAVFTKTAGTVNIDEIVTFDGSGSYDPDGTIVSFSWAFGDGTTGTGVTIQHAYSRDGIYTMNLTVTDNDGETDTTIATITVTIINKAPVASFTESAETVSTGKSIHFDASASHDPDGTITDYAWNFGDGTTATDVAVDHTYEDNSVYTVTLIVTDNDGATSSTTATKTVLNRSPVASFTEDATTVEENETIHFDASGSYDPDGTIVSYLWDFGDGTTGTEITTEYGYIEAGTYTVTLTVIDDDGASSSVVAEKTVETQEAETQEAVTLAVLSLIGLGVAALTATLLYGLYVRRRKKKKTENSFSVAYYRHFN
jgi:PKD repeat protein